MAYEFTGNNYISVGNISAFNLGLSAQPYTLALKFYRNTSGNQNLIGKGGGQSGWNSTNGHQWILIIQSSILYFQFYIGGGSLLAQIGSPAPAVSQWHSAAITYNGTTTSLFINGSSAGTTSGNYLQPSSAFRAVIGITPDIVGENTRQVAEVAIWHQAELSTAEIAALHTGFAADQIRPQSLSFYAPLVRDLNEVRSGNALTNMSATVATHPRIIT